MTASPLNSTRQPFQTLAHTPLSHELSVKLRREGRLSESEKIFRNILTAEPDYLEALIGLAHVLVKTNRNAEAEQIFDRISNFDSDFFLTSLTKNLLIASIDLTELLRKNEYSRLADKMVEKIIQIDLENEEMHRQFGMLLLQSGDFKYGWRERDKRVSALPKPVWNGESLYGKTILVQALHGFGDIIQFLRFLPMLKDRGAVVILEHPPALTTLLQGVEGWDTLVTRNTGQEILDIEFDTHIPLMSLPGIFDIGSDIPSAVPYVHPDPVLASQWHTRLSGDKRFKVGLVWAGNPDFKGDKLRSCSLADYSWLARNADIQFYSLQKGQAAQQAHSPTAKRIQLIDLAPELNDFADTAAAIMELDLVISVDTAVAHLAGALGRPVWTLIPYQPCWRWMYDRDDSSWYPTMRLFRQTDPDFWAPVIQNIFHALNSSIVCANF